MRKLIPKNKTGGIVQSTIFGVGSLLIGVIIILVITSTLLNANLLEGRPVEGNATAALSANFTVGIGNVSAKIPTILLIVAVVFLFSALILLMRNAKAMGIGGGGSL